MKEKLTNNLGMKILSFAIALISWIIIVNIDDPVITRTFPGISVDIIHEEAINSLNQVYEIVEGDVVNIAVKGKKSIVDSLNTSDFRAEADLNKLSSVNAVPIQPYIVKHIDGDVELSLGKVDTLRVSLEEVAEKQFQVTVDKKGNVQDGYSIGDIRVKPNLIKVSGAKSQISRITQVKVELDVSNASDPIDTDLEPKVYDSNGYLIDSSNMKFSSPKVRVSAELLNTKTIPLLIDTTGEPASGFKFVNIEYEPKKVTIAGKLKDLEDVKYIAIKLDISNANENIEEEVNLSDYIPKDIKIAEKNTTAMVKIAIAKLATTKITFGLDDLEVKNIPSNMTFSYKSLVHLSVDIQGVSDELAKIAIGDLHPYIDLSGLSKGTHNVRVQFVSNKKVKVLSSLTIQIQLLADNNKPKPNEESEAPTASPTKEPKKDNIDGKDNTNNKGDSKGNDKIDNNTKDTNPKSTDSSNDEDSNHSEDTNTDKPEATDTQGASNNS